MFHRALWEFDTVRLSSNFPLAWPHRKKETWKESNIDFSTLHVFSSPKKETSKKLFLVPFLFLSSPILPEPISKYKFSPQKLMTVIASGDPVPKTLPPRFQLISPSPRRATGCGRPLPSPPPPIYELILAPQENDFPELFFISRRKIFERV